MYKGFCFLFYFVFMQIQEQRKDLKVNEESFRDMQKISETLRYLQLESQKKRDAIFEDIMVEIFANTVKDINVQIQEAWLNSNRIKTTTTTTQI